MFNNILQETVYVEDMYSEYLQMVNRYSNLNRSAVFFRYININIHASTYELGTDATFDRYNSGVKHDIYDYTPGYFVSQVVNDGMDASDLVGQAFEGPLQVTVYTIKEPRIEDLVVFNRPPLNNEGAIFRVSNIRASLSGMRSNPSTNWFDLTLEYAPLNDLSKLSYINHYVYSLPFEKNILVSDFTRMVQESEKISSYLKFIEDHAFDQSRELYFAYFDGVRYAPLLQNKFLYDFLSTKQNYEDFFPHIKRPYGIKRITDYTYSINLDTNESIINTIEPQVMSTPILQFNGDVNVFSICNLLKTWIWEKNRLTYPEMHVPKDVNFGNVKTKAVTLDHAKFESQIGIKVDVGSLPLNILGKGE